METAAAPNLVPLADVIAGEVRSLIGRHRSSQEKLAAHVGISQPSLSKRLNGKKSWEIDELEKVAEYFHTSIADLITRWCSDATPVTSINGPSTLQLSFPFRPRAIRAVPEPKPDLSLVTT